MSKGLWLEVALNGAAGRAYQPLIPISVTEIIQEGIACAKAGASIVHLHAYDDTGKPCEDVDTYRRIIEGIKEHCDVIIYPTLSLTGSAEERHAPLIELAKLGLLEWGVIDPGSVNISHSLQVMSAADGIAYMNPDSHIRQGLELAARDNWRPAYAIYEPGFIRLGAAMAATITNIKTPIYRLMFSDNLLFGCKPSVEALNFYAGQLNETVPDAPWMLSGLDADISHIIKPAIELGAHIRVGLEDAPFGSQKSNVNQVEEAVDLIEKTGYSLAPIEEIRAAN